DGERLLGKLAPLELDGVVDLLGHGAGVERGFQRVVFESHGSFDSLHLGIVRSGRVGVFYTIKNTIKTVTEAVHFLKKSGGMITHRRLCEAIIGGPFKGSWWGHPKGKLIFNLGNALADRQD